MSNIYYGSKPIKNKRPATEIEAIQKRQVRLWGLNQINTNLLNDQNIISKKMRLITKNRTKLITMIFGHKGKIKRLQTSLKAKLTKEQIDVIKKEIEKLESELKSFNDKYNIINDEYQKLLK